ncbi:cell division protein FtsA [Anaplasmataceae bacterium AB001_6]|nr:cell division protein FtsA [Anaplasmataceae bacterium AB001_6]
MFFNFRMPRRNFFLVVDLGSKYIKSILVNFSLKTGTIKEIMDSYVIESSGVIGDNIINVQQMQSSISEILKKAERRCEENIEDVYICFSKVDIKTKVINEKINLSDKKISLVNIENLMSRISNCFDDNVMNIVPLNYSIDNMKGVKNPIGMYGKKMEICSHVICISDTSVLNIKHCLASNNLYLNGCSVSAYSSTLSVSLPEEKNLGIFVVDIGHFFTSVGFFRDDMFLKSNTISLGGRNITNDLAYALDISIEDAENIKRKYGGAYFTNKFSDKETIKIGNKTFDDRGIPVYSIVNYIRPRVEEIFDILFSEIKINHKIILTGGSSRLIGIKELVSTMYGVEVEIRAPFYSDVDSVNSNAVSPRFSSLAGMLSIFNNNIEYNGKINKEKKSNYINKIMSIFN